LETPYIYYDAALICVTMICEECHECCLDYYDLVEGPWPPFELRPLFPPGDYITIIGDEAFRRGWHVYYTAGGDLRTICPDCAQRLGHGATESSGE
jgi:hypothetical protein